MDVRHTHFGSAARRDGKVTIVFGLAPDEDIQVDVTAYAVELARDILTAYSTPGLGRIDQDTNDYYTPLGPDELIG
jgi:hypothetical protein